MNVTCRKVLVCAGIALCFVLSGCGGGGGDGTEAAASAPGVGTGGSGGSSGGNPPVPPAQQFAVSNTNPSAYEWDSLSTGKAVYIDRNFTFTDIPAGFQDLRYLRTANNDKYVSGAGAVAFDINQSVTVYVAFDSTRAAPGWLQSWTDTGEQWGNTDKMLDVYQKDFAAGTVSLGGNEVGGSMYSVALSVAGGGSAPLAINGTPGTSIASGLDYSFRPDVSGGSGNLTFTIVNPPSWASFSSTTGALTGTPGSVDIGTTASGIVISVSDDQTSQSLQPFSISVISSGSGSAMLSWTAPTQNADNTPLMGSDLVGYTVHYGTTPGDYPNSKRISSAGTLSAMVENLAPGTWSFVVTAYDQFGNESDYSNVVTKTIAAN